MGVGRFRLHVGRKKYTCMHAVGKPAICTLLTIINEQ